MTISNPKYRVYPPDAFPRIKGSTTVGFANPGVVGWTGTPVPGGHLGVWASDNNVITNYMLDNSDYDFGLVDFDFAYDDLPGWGFYVDMYNTFYSMGWSFQNIVHGTVSLPVSNYAKVYATRYQWMSKDYCLNHVWSTPTETTRVTVLNASSTWSQQNIFAVALNGPTAGEKTIFQHVSKGDAFIGPDPNSHAWTQAKYLLPDHPAGYNDKVYYGIVHMFGATLNDIPWYNPSYCGVGVVATRCGFMTEVIKRSNGYPV